MEDLKLDIEKIDKLLISIGKDRIWLQKKTGITRQLMFYHWKAKPVKAAPLYAKVWDMNPKDLIKW